MRKLKSVLAMTLVIMLLSSLVPAFAASNSFTLYNYTGQSITEIYLYPSYNSKFGNPRNTKGYVYDRGSVTISVTSQEANLNCSWNLRITLRDSKYRSTWYVWEELNLSSLLGDQLNLTCTSDGHLNLASAGSPDTTVNRSVKVTNLTGDSMTEVYIYPSNNSKWGNSRTTGWIYNGYSSTFAMTSAETAVNTGWNITICFRSGNRAYSVTWSDWDINWILGKELTVYMSGSNTYSIDTSDLGNYF